MQIITFWEKSKVVRVLTRILKVGVRDSLFIKGRSPSQKIGVPLPKNRSPFFFFHDSPLIVSMSPVTSFYKLMENQFPYFHILFYGALHYVLFRAMHVTNW